MTLGQGWTSVSDAGLGRLACRYFLTVMLLVTVRRAPVGSVTGPASTSVTFLSFFSFAAAFLEIFTLKALRPEPVIETVTVPIAPLSLSFFAVALGSVIFSLPVPALLAVSVAARPFLRTAASFCLAAARLAVPARRSAFRRYARPSCLLRSRELPLESGRPAPLVRHRRRCPAGAATLNECERVNVDPSSSVTVRLTVWSPVP